jgi:hypothetical protein
MADLCLIIRQSISKVWYNFVLEQRINKEYGGKLWSALIGEQRRVFVNTEVELPVP